MALGPKIWPRGPNHSETDFWGQGESIDTHIVGFCEKRLGYIFVAKTLLCLLLYKIFHYGGAL